MYFPSKEAPWTHKVFFRLCLQFLRICIFPDLFKTFVSVLHHCGCGVLSFENAAKFQGGTCCASVRAALTERSGSSTKGRTPNIRYFVAKLSIVRIYALFERLE